MNISYHYDVEPRLRENMSARVVRRAVNRGLGRAATKVAREWRIRSKQYCPVRTGALRRSLTTVRTKNRRPGGIDSYTIEIGPRGIITGTNKERRANRQQFYFYILISEGFHNYLRRRRRNALPRYRGVPLRKNFVEDAFKDIEQKVKYIIRNEIWESLRREWSRRGYVASEFPLPNPGLGSEFTFPNPETGGRS